MNDFLEFFRDTVKHYPMHLEIAYSKTIDWTISVWKKGCGKLGEDAVIVSVQNCDMEFAFAKAQVELKEWLLSHEGGY